MKNNLTTIFLLLNICLNISPSFSQSVINRPNLQLGNEGNVVSELQAILKLLGYYHGQVNGNYSEEVKLAVAQFQQAAGLTATGVVDSNTWRTLLPSEVLSGDRNPVVSTNTNTDNNTTTTNPNSINNTKPNNTSPPNNNKPDLKAENMPLLREGMSGEAVKILQQRLKKLGIFKGVVDGIFGVETLQAVLAAQAKFKLGADGVVGLQTWRAILGN
jgi:peptidoglycan hydrolase-like protein with peptidoglycan-binding domain